MDKLTTEKEIKPLTKEQKEYIIKKLDRAFKIKVPLGVHDHDSFSDGLMASEYRVKQLLNKCTEKEFPAFKIGMPDESMEGKSLINFDYVPNNEGYDVEMGVQGGRWPVGLNLDNMKELAEGCKKIVEFMENKE